MVRKEKGNLPTGALELPFIHGSVLLELEKSEDRGMA